MEVKPKQMYLTSLDTKGKPIYTEMLVTGTDRHIEATVLACTKEYKLTDYPLFLDEEQKHNFVMYLHHKYKASNVLDIRIFLKRHYPHHFKLISVDDIVSTLSQLKEMLDLVITKHNLKRIIHVKVNK